MSSEVFWQNLASIKISKKTVEIMYFWFINSEEVMNKTLHFVCFTMAEVSYKVSQLLDDSSWEMSELNRVFWKSSLDKTPLTEEKYCKISKTERGNHFSQSQWI